MGRCDPQHGVRLRPPHVRRALCAQTSSLGRPSLLTSRAVAAAFACTERSPVVGASGVERSEIPPAPSTAWRISPLLQVHSVAGIPRGSARRVHVSGPAASRRRLRGWCWRGLGTAADRAAPRSTSPRREIRDRPPHVSGRGAPSVCGNRRRRASRLSSSLRPAHRGELIGAGLASGHRCRRDR
jgi:hypothetical protein